MFILNYNRLLKSCYLINFGKKYVYFIVQVLRRQMLCSPEMVCTHIRACMALHNIGIDRGDIIPFVVDDLVNREFHNVQGEDGRTMRDYITRTSFG